MVADAVMLQDMEASDNSRVGGTSAMFHASQTRSEN